MLEVGDEGCCGEPIENFYIPFIAACRTEG